MPVPITPASARALTPQHQPTSSIHSEPGCTAQYKGTELGCGRLYVAETNIVWIRDGDEVGFKLNYRQLIAHAISKDVSVYPMPCVYMLYENVGEPQSPNSSDDEEEEEGNIEIRIAPHNENQVQRIYQAISDGQLLHPDDDEESDSGDDQGFTPGGLAISNQIRFDSDGQLLVNRDNEQEMEDGNIIHELTPEESRRFEDMEED
ncbi:methylosome subunit pICln-like [Bolinopsis microptera]|uniref:methylosome subunit pICln-like n=1 Tax=Bolinopsis microptera TaxID=2820187 RepID=UPI003078F969